MASNGSELESTFVRDVYREIAPHFSDTRHKPWPKVKEFLTKLPRGSLVADVGRAYTYQYVYFSGWAEVGFMWIILSCLKRVQIPCYILILWESLSHKFPGRCYRLLYVTPRGMYRWHLLPSDPQHVHYL